MLAFRVQAISDCPKELKSRTQGRFLTLTHCTNKKTTARVVFVVWWSRRDCSAFALHPRKLRPKGPLRRLSVQAISDCLVEPKAVSHPHPLHKQKTTARVVFVVWWSRRESNPRPQALHRQFYILSCVV
jgi:hypothetical protein